MADLYNPNINNLYDAMDTSTRRIGIIQTNLDNVHTIGYKNIYDDSALFSQTLKQVFRDKSQGAFNQTGQVLDMAISHPEGFFLVEGENGPERTRDGQFHISSQGQIVDSMGRKLVILEEDPEDPAALHYVRGEDFKVDPSGSIRANGVRVGKIAVDFTPVKPGERAFILQGKLEQSNSDLSSSITKLMMVKRHVDQIQGVMSMELSVDKALIDTYGRNF